MLIRLARKDDIPFVRDLALQSLLHGIPPTRDATPEDVQAVVRRTYADLDRTFDQERNSVILVAEADGTLAGYIMLDFGTVEASTGERQTFITDLAVVQNLWGQGTTHALIDKSCALTAARGDKYLVGHVSANNHRTLRIAQEALGFVIERHQIVKRCR